MKKNVHVGETRHEFSAAIILYIFGLLKKKRNTISKPGATCALSSRSVLFLDAGI